MNILYIFHYAGSPDLGMAFRPYYLSKEWIKQGHEVTIIAADYSHLRVKNPDVEYDFQEQIIDGIKYVWVKTNRYSGNGAKRALAMFTFVGKLVKNAKRIKEKYNPDVVITSSTYPLDTYAGQRIKDLAKAKYIHEVHDMWPSTLYEVGGMSKKHPFVVLMQMAENYAYRHCDACVALLPYTKEYMVAHGLKPEKFVNIQNGVVQEEWENPLPLPKEHEAFFRQHQDHFIVGYFGGHALSNVLDTVLDVAKEMQGGREIFVLVGKGVEKERLIKRTRDEKIKNVFFLPPVEKKAVPSLVEHFDCSIMTGKPSPLYRFGLSMNKMYDSMMAGKPIICAMDAPKTLVEEYNCGFQTASNDYSAIKNAILALEKMTEDERIQIGQNGRNAVLKHFTYEKLAQQFAELF